MKNKIIYIYKYIYIYLYVYLYKCLSKWKLLSHVRCFCDPMDYTVMEFSRPEYWSILEYSNPGLLHCRQILYQLSCLNLYKQPWKHTAQLLVDWQPWLAPLYSPVHSCQSCIFFRCYQLISGLSAGTNAGLFLQNTGFLWVTASVPHHPGGDILRTALRLSLTGPPSEDCLSVLPPPLCPW